MFIGTVRLHFLGQCARSLSGRRLLSHGLGIQASAGLAPLRPREKDLCRPWLACGHTLSPGLGPLCAGLCVNVRATAQGCGEAGPPGAWCGELVRGLLAAGLRVCVTWLS